MFFLNYSEVIKNIKYFVERTIYIDRNIYIFIYFTETLHFSPKSKRISPLALLLFFSPCVYGNFPKYNISVLKIPFDIREAQEDGNRGDSNLESISKYEKVKQESFWNGILCNWAWQLFTDISKLQAPQSCKQPGSIKAHCALNHTVDPWFVIPVYDTLRREWAEKAGAIIERKHKE